MKGDIWTFEVSASCSPLHQPWTAGVHPPVAFLTKPSVGEWRNTKGIAPLATLLTCHMKCVLKETDCSQSVASSADLP
eukprot:1161253-Pelagomonas_calceolata.AAC.2